MKRPSLNSILWVFARHGNVKFGGGSATIAELEGEIVERRDWVSHDQSRLSYALSRITPGTNLLAYCAGVGWLLRGASGVLMALVAASVPCSILAVLVTALYEWWSRNGIVAIQQLNTAIVVTRTTPGPVGLYIVSVGYFVDGTPGAIAGWLAMITPALLVVPLIKYAGPRSEHPRVRGMIQMWCSPVPAFSAPPPGRWRKAPGLANSTHFSWWSRLGFYSREKSRAFG